MRACVRACRGQSARVLINVFACSLLECSCVPVEFMCLLMCSCVQDNMIEVHV